MTGPGSARVWQMTPLPWRRPKTILPAQIFGHPLNLILSFEIARFPAVATIILPVIGQAKLVISMAKGTIAIASALVLRLVAHKTFKFLGEHRVNLLPSLRFRPRAEAGQPTNKNRGPGNNCPHLIRLSVMGRSKSRTHQDWLIMYRPTPGYYTPPRAVEGAAGAPSGKNKKAVWGCVIFLSVERFWPPQALWECGNPA
jgi:hypothetical protein